VLGPARIVTVQMQKEATDEFTATCILYDPRSCRTLGLHNI
jgi:hypothetical protein